MTCGRRRGLPDRWARRSPPASSPPLGRFPAAGKPANSAATRWFSPFALLLLCLLAGCAGRQTCSLVRVAEMPLRTSHHLLLVTAGIKDEPVRLLVDTGAERTVLTEAAVARLGLSRDAHRTRSVGVGGVSASWDARVPGIVLGGVLFPIKHVAVGRFQMGHLSFPGVDGLLGADILLAFDLDLDIPDHRLTLYRTRRCADAVPPWPAVEVHGVEARRDRMLVPFAVNGVTGMAVLDTGAQASAVSAEMARRAGASSKTLTGDPTILVHGAGPSPVTVPVQMFRTLRIGPEHVVDPRLTVLPNDIGLGDGLVGADFIRGRRLWVSFPTRRLFIGLPGPG